MSAQDRSSGRSNWPKDDFGRSEITGQWLWLLGPVLLAVLCLVLWVPRFLRREIPVAVLYAAQDQVYAEPILKNFEQRTGIRVDAVFDSEATKTVGLANRLLAERKHPQCDVFWGNEELRTRQLAASGVFRRTNGWAAFGYRSRRVALAAAATNLLTPKSLLDLTNESYRGQVALAYPQFGTTATHFLALRQYWGESNWLTWCRALAANRPLIADGNSVAVALVTRGEAALALTDSDDIAAAIREGASLRALPITPETLLIPNTVAVIRDSPHPDAAQQLFEFLQRRDVTEELVAAGALEGASFTDVPRPVLSPDWAALLRELVPATETLKRIFRR